MKKRTVSIGLLLICLISFIYVPNSFGVSQLTSVFPEGTDNVYEGHEYDFSATYYNDSDYSQQYTSAILETQFEDFGIGENYSLTSLDTMFNYYPDNLTANQGIYNTEGTPNLLDDDYYNISSTQVNSSIPSESNFTISEGNLISYGDLNDIDSDFTVSPVVPVNFTTFR